MDDNGQEHGVVQGPMTEDGKHPDSSFNAPMIPQIVGPPQSPGTCEKMKSTESKSDANNLKFGRVNEMH